MGPPGLAEAQQTHLPSGIPAHTSCLPCPGTRLGSIRRCWLAPAPGCAGMSLGSRALSQAGGWDGAPKSSPKWGPAPREHPSLAGQMWASLEAVREANQVGTPTSCATSHLEMLCSIGVQPPPGSSRLQTRSRPKKPPGPSKDCSERPGPAFSPPDPQTKPPRDSPELEGGSGFGEGAAAVPGALPLPTVPLPGSPPLRSGAGACGGQTWRLQRTTTLTSERGAAGKRLPPPLPGCPQAGALSGFTGTGLTAPSRGLPGSSGASPGRQRSKACWGSRVLSAVTFQLLDAPGDPSIPPPRHDGPAGWKLGASGCFFPPEHCPEFPFWLQPQQGPWGPPRGQQCRDAPAPAPPHPQHPAWSRT